MSIEDEQFNKLVARVSKLERMVEFLLQQTNLQYVDAPLQTGVSSEVFELAKKGKLIEAIKLYRQETGVGLAEAKQTIEHLQF